MKSFLRTGICVILQLIAVESILGQPPTMVDMKSVLPQDKCISITFPLNKSDIDNTYLDNKCRLDELHNAMSNTTTLSKLDSIVITAQSSPDGSYAHNMLLAQRRANAIKAYILQKYPHIDPGTIKTYTYTNYWDGLINTLAQHPNAPGRDSFLKALADPSLTNDQKIRQMTTIQKGAFFNYIRNNDLLTYLRRGSCAIWFHPPPLETSLTIAGISTPKSDLKCMSLNKTPITLPQQPKTITTYPLALRTNLLLCLLGGPNLAIEVPINRHISIAGGFDFAYTRFNNQYALQTKQATLEGRYWINPQKNPLTGWNIGIYGTYNDRFDLQWKDGWQGDGYWSGGLSAGYSVPINNRFNIDLSVMGGYLYSPEMRRYTTPQNGHLMWQETRYNVSRVALTQVRVSVVWLLKQTREMKK